MPTRRSVLKALIAAPGLPTANAVAQTTRIQHVDIYHHSHTDVGFTDLPSVCRDMQVRYLDTAIDACLNDKSFRWTAEALLTVDDWWRAKSAQRRSEFLRVVQSGRMDVMAMPFNQAPFMNAMQWKQALAWIPESLWRQLNPRAAMQNDVNGCPRAGAMLLLDRGIRHLLMGINADSGGPPFRRPTAFWWKMPDDRRIFVWLGEHYGTAYRYFEPKGWQRGQAKGGNTALYPPREGDHLRADEASLRASHAYFVQRIQSLEASGYEFDRLILSYTNQWRYDNDTAFLPLGRFVEAWNRLGLKPSLRLTTATQAVLDMEKAVGARISTKEGEWTDWWANGDASGPREVAASRFAKRAIAAAVSPVFGPMNDSGKRRVEEMLKDLCLFDEHTWGANVSISQPDGLETLGQYTEKSLLAYKPKGHAEWLLGQRARTLLGEKPEGLYVTNAMRSSFTGWVSFSATALRDEYTAVEDPKTGKSWQLFKPKGSPSVKFWAQDLAPVSTAALRLSKSAVKDSGDGGKPAVETDAGGWPMSVVWQGMKKPLFTGGTGDFLAVTLSNRGAITRLHATPEAAKREEMRKSAVKEIAATPGKGRMEETPHTRLFVQPFEHPRLENAVRQIEIWNREPRARLTVRFTRTSSAAPEVLFINFAFPTPGVMPVLSNGGIPFVPYRDQLEGSCRDYFAIDGWARYDTPDGQWLWVTRDAPLMTVGGPHTLARHSAAPADTHRVMSMVFDNSWHTNFVANSHGEMEFQFELIWRERIGNAGDLADTLVSEPVVLINPATKESPEMMKNLFRT
jgi:hypothetical protein